MSDLTHGVFGIPRGLPPAELLGPIQLRENAKAEKMTEKKREKINIDKLQSLGRRTEGPPPEVKDQEDRNAADSKWMQILTQLRTWGASGLPTHDAKLCEWTREVLQSKAPATSIKRAGAITMLMDWQTRSGKAAWPPATEVVEDYCRYANTKSASRTQSLLEALSFLEGVFEVPAFHLVTPAARGLASAGLKTKKDTVKRKTIPAAVLRRWEEWVMGAELAHLHAKKNYELSLNEAVICGFLVFVTHARARAGDATRVKKEPTLDEVSGRGYLEAGAQAFCFKTGHAAKKAGKVLPLVAISHGLSGAPWAAAWLELRKAAGLNAQVDQTLQPEYLLDGTFGAARMRTSDVAACLRAFVSRAGHGEDVLQYGAHSAKATLLSWAAKFSLGIEDRRLLGGHADPQAKSALEYSRDALAGPLRALEGLLTQVRLGRFRPDVTRSGRWACDDSRCKSCGEEAKEGKECMSCGAVVHPYCSRTCPKYMFLFVHSLRSRLGSLLWR